MDDTTIYVQLRYANTCTLQNELERYAENDPEVWDRKRKSHLSHLFGLSDLVSDMNFFDGCRKVYKSVQRRGESLDR